MVYNYPKYPQLLVEVDFNSKKVYTVFPNGTYIPYLILVEAYNLYKSEVKTGTMVIKGVSKTYLVINENTSFEQLYETYKAKAKEALETENQLKQLTQKEDKEFLQITLDSSNPVLQYYIEKLSNIASKIRPSEITPVYEKGIIVKPSNNEEYNLTYAEYIKEYDKARVAAIKNDKDYANYIAEFNKVRKQLVNAQLFSKYPQLKEYCILLLQQISKAIKDSEYDFNNLLMPISEYIKTELELSEEMVTENEYELIN